MSISKSWLADPKNVNTAAALYRDVSRLLTVTSIAEELKTTHQTVGVALKRALSPEEYRALKAVRYSASKTGEKNPMLGKTGDQHPNWQGECEDGRGYLTCLHNGQRVFVHRKVMMEALGLSELPPSWVVHHIDGNPKNNTLDNLALATKAGHNAIHALQTMEYTELQSRRETIVERVRSMISPSMKTSRSSSKA